MRVEPFDAFVKLKHNFNNVTLTCKADGAMSYNWERQNGNIPAGNYRCVATNGSGSSYSKYAEIVVEGEFVYCDLCIILSMIE